ncbi:hypothetical protein RND81_06G195400 [Saponaria officinalis]|uniref:Presenilin n=1 Tax=Saponaria officinalis TaxID=3572 RepID=A0AAW1KC79_SAPOF
MEGSILEFIGSELISVISPVSICMFLVVLLVSSLSSSSSSSSTQTQLVTAANLVYAETPTDTTAAKFTGAVENAVVFIILIAAVTFLLVILYYYRFTNFLKNYMRFSTFFILLSMGGAIFISIIKHFSVGVDAVSFFLFMFNFSAVGVVAVFGGGGIPIVVTQGYTVVLGIITAAWFTQLPEWTTWVLLVALAVYDLVAVLAPGGPLKLLVELAQSRNDDLPALVYEARPTVRVRVSRDDRGGGEGPMVGVSENVGVEMQNLNRNDDNSENVGVEITDVNRDIVGEVDVEGGRGRESERVALMSNVESSSEIRVVSDERAPPVEDDGGSETMIQGIKLGLGDFVFYSVLVGRAAMYDLMTVYACYLAIISGLACTLILLSVWRRALPALPISIALGIMFYFLTRLLMEPFVVQTSTNLLMF